MREADAREFFLGAGIAFGARQLAETEGDIRFWR